MRIEERAGQLVIIDFNELEAYKIAVKIEEDGLEFYKRLSEKITSDKARETIVFLRNEEAKHLRFFQGFLSALRENKEDSFEEDNLLKNIDYGIFWPYPGVKELEKILDEPKKALKLGLVIEDKSIKFYESCKDKVNSSQSKNEITNIVEEEKKHKKMIQDLLDSLSVS